MAYTNFPDGITSMGVPFPGGGGALPMTTKYYFVNSVTGSNGNEGTSPESPFATIDYAIGRCAANKGETIVVMQGHAETVTAAGGITADVAGINIIGLGTGADRPEISFGTAASASFLVTAANVLVANIVGISAVDALTNPFHIQAAGCTLGDFTNGPVEWQDPSSALQAVRAVLTTAAADNFNVNLKVTGITSGGTAPVNVMRLVGVNDASINLNVYGRASTAVVEFLTTACTNIEITGYIYNASATDGSLNVVDTVTASTWAAKFIDGSSGAQVFGGSAKPIFSTSSQPGSSFAGTNLSAKVISNAATSLTTGASPVSLFTVTGTVIARVFAKIPTAITSTLNNGTLAVGVSGATAALLPSTTADGTNFPNNSVWVGDNSPTVAAEVFSATSLNWALITNGADIIATVATNSMTAGAITFYCQWIAVDPGSSVVAA